MEVNIVKYPGCDLPYKVTMPMSLATTKTKRDYTWLIDRKYKYFVDALKKACKVITYEELHKKVNHTFRYAMGKVTGARPSSIEYAMRSIRCTVATQYIKLKTECAILKVRPPPNPLQHLSDKTTKEHYAATGADNEHNAIERLIERGEYK